jgi:hypothetical protein
MRNELGLTWQLRIIPSGRNGRLGSKS